MGNLPASGWELEPGTGARTQTHKGDLVDASGLAGRGGRRRDGHRGRGRVAGAALVVLVEQPVAFLSGLEPAEQGSVAGALGGWDRGGRGPCGGFTEPLDLATQDGLGVEPGPGDVGVLRDGLEGDRGAGSVEFTSRTDRLRVGELVPVAGRCVAADTRPRATRTVAVDTPVCAAMTNSERPDASSCMMWARTVSVSLLGRGTCAPLMSWVSKDITKTA